MFIFQTRPKKECCLFFCPLEVFFRRCQMQAQKTLSCYFLILGFHLHKGSSGWNGRFEKNGTQSIGRTRGGWNTKLHMVAASDRDGVIFSLSAGNCGDGPEGRALLQQLGPVAHPVYLLMGRAYEGDETRALAVEPGYYLLFRQRAIVKSLGTTIRNCTNNVIRLRDFFVASSVFLIYNAHM